MPIFTKRPPPRESGKKKILYVFGKENPAGQNADQQDCLRRTIPQIVSVFTGIGR
jgi:hypothetical protein